MSPATWEVIKVEPGKYLETMKALKKDGLNHLSDLTAVDWKDRGVIEVVVHLAALTPGAFMASAVSISTIFACGRGLLNVAP